MKLDPDIRICRKCGKWHRWYNRCNEICISETAVHNGNKISEAIPKEKDK